MIGFGRGCANTASAAPAIANLRSAQKLTVLLAFTAAALSFSALTIVFLRTGTIQATPLLGGLLMLALGLAGYVANPPVEES